jgi:hypothetical protein
MARRKTNKEYAVRLTHPTLGVFYYHYTPSSYYYSSGYIFYFTQNLSKVKTWKTQRFVQKEILNIQDRLNKKSSKIYLSLGTSVPDELKNKVVISRKRYFYPINSITSKFHLDEAENTIKQLSNTITADSKLVAKMAKKLKISDKFMEIVDRLYKDVKVYKEKNEFLHKMKNSNSESIYLDIVDASYGFRLLKLKTLKNINVEEIEEMDTE